MPVFSPTALQALADGKAGYNVFTDQHEIKDDPMIESHFTRLPSWNAPSMLENKPGPIAALISNSIFGPLKEPPADDDDPANALRTAFLDTNSNFLRHSKTSRLWSPTERYNLLPQMHYGPSLALIRFVLPSGKTTKPLLCTLGASATMPAGSYWHTQDLFGENIEIPPLVPNHPFPMATAPAVFSLSPDSRNLIEKGTPRTILPTLVDQTRCIASVNARQMFTAIPVHNKLHSAEYTLQPDDPFATTALWTPETRKNAKWTIDTAISTAWTAGLEPPNPTETLQPWTVSPLSPDSPATTTPQSRHTDKVKVDIGVEPTGQSRGGVLLVPKTLLLPPQTTLPIGLPGDTTARPPD